MIPLIVATRNAHKTREFAALLRDEFAVSDLNGHGDIPLVEETGLTFEENAKLKALAASRVLPGLVVADDSGLEVDALGGAPGVYSARYAGHGATDSSNVAKLLADLRRADPNGENRRARFRCVLCVARDQEVMGTFEGATSGTICDVPRGVTGFGYDPVFQPTGFEQTFSELGESLKNTISHRSRAVAKMGQKLQNWPEIS